MICNIFLEINPSTIRSLFALTHVEKFAKDKHMKLNKSKTKCMIFDLSNLGIMGNFNHPASNEQIEIFNEIKILGFHLTDNLDFQKTVDLRCISARRCLWTLVRLREAHFPLDKLVKIYCMNIRSILEYSVLVILNSLTKKQLEQFETVQKKATQIMMKDYSSCYEDRLKICKIPSLKERWEKMFVKFANDVVKSGRLQNWLIPNQNTNVVNLRKQNIFHVPLCRTERYKRSAINSVIRAVNNADNFKIVFDD